MENGNNRRFPTPAWIIYTLEADEKPVVATKTCDTFKEGDILFRYSGQSILIKYPELRAIIDARLTRERQAWLQHLQIIAHSGPTNIGIVDTIRGKIFGGSKPFLLDESLLRNLKFIRRGSFSEAEGAPTLRLVGEVQLQDPIHVGIHGEDLVEAFLAQRPLAEPEAKEYLKETAYQPTPFVPIHYFIGSAKLSSDEALGILNASTTPFVSTAKRLRGRVALTERISRMGAIGDLECPPSPFDSSILENQLSQLTKAKDKRTLLAIALRIDPALVVGLVPTVPILCLADAVTHLSVKEVQTHRDKLLELLLSIFASRFTGMMPAERSSFRKAIAYCDEMLFSDLGSLND
jgi:hypothetical protein